MSSLLPPPRLLLADNSRIRYRASVRHIPYRSPTHDHAPEVQAHEAQSSRSAPPPLFWAYPIPPPPSALRYAELRYRLGNSDQAPVPLGPRWGSGTETWLPVTFPGWAALASGTNGLYRVRDIDLCAPSRFCDPFFFGRSRYHCACRRTMGVFVRGSRRPRRLLPSTSRAIFHPSDVHIIQRASVGGQRPQSCIHCHAGSAEEQIPWRASILHIGPSDRPHFSCVALIGVYDVVAGARLHLRAVPPCLRSSHGSKLRQFCPQLVRLSNDLQPAPSSTCSSWHDSSL